MINNFLKILIIIPLNHFFSKILKSEQCLVRYEFNFTTSTCHMSYKLRNLKRLNDKLLIHSYLLLLSKYFYLCDSRQRYPIKMLLVESFGNGEIQTETFAKKVFEAIYPILDNQEKEVLNKLFFIGIPPLACSEEKISKGVISKYTFLVLGEDEIKGGLWQLSFGLNTILLPLAIAHFYEFVAFNLKNKENKLILNELVLIFLNSFSLEKNISRKNSDLIPEKIMKTL